MHVSALTALLQMGDEHKLLVAIGDLRCRADCGFYGNPAWEGYCSKCYRERSAQLSKTKQYQANREKLAFEKFEEKRKQQTDKRSSTLKSAFLGVKEHASAVTSPRPQPSKSTARRSLSPDSRETREAFLKYLRKCPKPVAQELSRVCSSAVEQISTGSHRHAVDDLAYMVQDLYSHISTKLAHNIKDAGLNMEDTLSNVEHYVCVRSYHVLFCPNNDEEVGDLSLQDRIRSLHWVTSGFLDTNLDFSIPTVGEKIDLAITEMIEMNSKRAVVDKLDCLLRCCYAIFDALKVSREGVPASADDFLPVLIYVLLKGNPPLLLSNTKYITRFSLPSRVDTGETGYYFTNLCCAIRFIQNLNGDSLRMPAEEFEAYTTGQLVPPINEANSKCHQILKSMERNVAALDRAIEQQEQLQQRVEEFKLHTKRETDAVMAQLKAFQQAYPPPPTFEEWEASIEEKLAAKLAKDAASKPLTESSKDE